MNLKNWLKTIAAFVLRLVLLMPLTLLAHATHGLGRLFESLGDSLCDAASSLRQFTVAPHVTEMEQSLADANIQKREELIRALKEFRQ